MTFNFYGQYIAAVQFETFCKKKYIHGEYNIVNFRHRVTVITVIVQEK